MLQVTNKLSEKKSIRYIHNQLQLFLFFCIFIFRSLSSDWIMNFPTLVWSRLHLVIDKSIIFCVISWIGRRHSMSKRRVRHRNAYKCVPMQAGSQTFPLTHSFSIDRSVEQFQATKELYFTSSWAKLTFFFFFPLLFSFSVRGSAIVLQYLRYQQALGFYSTVLYCTFLSYVYG